jgi:hypothetical protein
MEVVKVLLLLYVVFYGLPRPAEPDTTEETLAILHRGLQHESKYISHRHVQAIIRQYEAHREKRLREAWWGRFNTEQVNPKKE